MVGLVHELLFAFIKDNLGEEALCEVKKRSNIPLDQTFRLDTYYSDQEWQFILRNTLDIAGLNQDDAETAFASYFGKAVLKEFPGFFAGASSVKEMVLRQPKIHNCIGTGVADPKFRKTITDKFSLEEKENGTIMHYVSTNRHCTLYRSMVDWLAEHYHEQVTIEEPLCLKKGDSECQIHITYLGQK